MNLTNSPSLSLVSGVSAGVNLRKNYQDEVTVREGESVELVCSADKEVGFDLMILMIQIIIIVDYLQVGQCTWETANGQFRPFYPGAKYPRLSRSNPENNMDCGVNVSYSL